MDLKTTKERQLGVTRIIRTKCLGSFAALSLLVIGGSGLVAPEAKAETLREALGELVKTHKRMLAATAEVNKAKEEVEVAWGDWYPNLEITANIGAEKQQKPSGSDDTDMVPRNVETSITQKLWDFGSVNSAIRKSKLTYQQKLVEREGTRQALLFEGLRAYLQVVRFSRQKSFAEGSAANIKRQADLEDAKVQRGSGFSTDVLQAKTQLAGALARVIQTNGLLQDALNRYRAVFNKIPDDIEKMKAPRLPLELLPKSLDDAIAVARRSNVGLAVQRLLAAIAREEVIKSRADNFLPTVELIGEHTAKKDESGTVGAQQETSVKVEAKYEFNLGLTAINSLRASQQNHISKTNTMGDTVTQVELSIRNAWDKLQTDKANAEHLHNQADIAAEFLELARRERQLGNRSLIDVLAGETALINASSDAAGADIDVAIDVFQLLNIVQGLAPKIIDRADAGYIRSN